MEQREQRIHYIAVIEGADKRFELYKNGELLQTAHFQRRDDENLLNAALLLKTVLIGEGYEKETDYLSCNHSHLLFEEHFIKKT